MKNMRKKRFLGPLIFVAVFAASSAVVMLLWNWLIPVIIGWTAINFWQAAGLLLLCKLLFAGFNKAGHGFRHGPHRHFSMKEKEEMRERVKSMSPEERKEYIRRTMFGDNIEDKGCGNG